MRYLILFILLFLLYKLVQNILAGRSRQRQSINQTTNRNGSFGRSGQKFDEAQDADFEIIDEDKK